MAKRRPKLAEKPLKADPFEGLADSDSWADGLSQPYDDVPTFDTAADPEVDAARTLAGDRRHVTTPTRRLFVDYRADAEAFAHIDPLPADGETLHGMISGRYALFDLLPALIAHAGDVTDLHLSTLSFSKQNAADLLGLIDGGQVRRVSLLISYYFKSTSRELYDLLVPQLRSRGHRVLAMRTHAKLLLARTADGAAYTVESSANLRSSKNVEQFAMTRDAGLYQWHRGIADELLAGREEGAAGAG